MEIKGLIFDMDGTLIQSMEYWRVGLRWDACRLAGLSDAEAEAFLAEHWTWEEIREGLVPRNAAYEDGMTFWQENVHVCLARFYDSDVQPVAGAVEFLRAMKERGMKLGVATATPRHVAAHALEHLGMLELLDAFISTKDIGTEKTEPDVYLECAKLMGLEKDEVVVFEDALYCGRTLKKHGFTFIGIHDPTMPEEQWAEFAPLCSRTVEDYRELL
ncbi:MAG: HAD family phosphatase [Oscillospiraceae bacterium]|nr:HAD family phosphatase [Oscillospiraceae bacterium]